MCSCDICLCLKKAFSNIIEARSNLDLAEMNISRLEWLYGPKLIFGKDNIKFTNELFHLHMVTVSN